MAQELTFNITEDVRRLKRPTAVKDFRLSFGHADQGPTDVVIGDDGNIVQGRYGDSARQVFVNVVQGKNNEPVDITGYLPEFNGCIPDAEHIVIDNWDGVLVDPRHGRFRFDFPIQAFTVAGSYKQAYFRLVQNGTGKTLATLEFDMQVLEDFVYSNIVPQNYVTPYLDMINKLKDAYTNFVGKTQDSFDQAKQRLDDIMSGVEERADTVEQRLKIEQQALETLSQKIKDNNLFTQAEADALKQLIEQTFDTKLNDFEAKVNHKIERLSQDSVNHILRYHSISVSVSPSMQLTDNDIAHLQKLNAEATLISMVNITSKTDSNPQLDNDSRLNDAISRLKNANIKIDMLKPHLGINWSDGFYRGDYDPALYSDFFDNWSKILLHYAEICKQNDIPILCIGCEQVKTFQATHAESWNDIIAKIHTAYPNLLLTAAFNQLEQVPSYNWPANLDYIGTNVYPALSPYFDENNLLKLNDLRANFYYDMQGIPWGARISAINDAYHRPIFVTECGCMPEKDGLVQSISQYASQTPYDYHVSALCMETAFSGWMKDIPSIVGFAWWHVRDPFNFYDGETESEAETVYKKYVGGGLI